jgi:hypothetical protein
MRGLVASVSGGPEADTPLALAQEIMYQAFNSPKPADRVRLARKALDVCAECADAYVLLAEHAQNGKEALEYYEKGVAAGKRAIGPETFQEAAGHFWGLVETRPYMRALKGLALGLWSEGRHDTGVGQLQEMLRLNPNDNQGVRDILATWLLLCDRDQELARLLEHYREETASWMYNRALLVFRQQGDTPETRELLNAAAKQNKFVPGFLLDEMPLPERAPEYYGLGDPNEAAIYAGANLTAWKSTPGAVTWVREVLKKPKQPKGRRAAPSGPSDNAKAKLGRLRMVDDVWEAGFRQIPAWVESEKARVIPWAVLVVSPEQGLILATELVPAEPTADRLWDVLAETMKKPAKGDPHRPARIRTEPDARWDLLQPYLADLGIALETVDQLELFREIFANFREFMSKDQPPGLLEVPGVTPEIVGRFYKAAAEFYRKAPWRFLGDDKSIKIECAKYQSGPWYAVLMGQSGITLGVALYEDLSLLRRLWANQLSERENARRTVALAVTFDSMTGMNPKDLEAASEHGWEIAGPEAHPTVYRKEPGMAVRPPLSWELELLESSMRALPVFVAEHNRDDRTPYRTTVAVASAKTDLILSWAHHE